MPPLPGLMQASSTVEALVVLAACITIGTTIRSDANTIRLAIGVLRIDVKFISISF